MPVSPRMLACARMHMHAPVRAVSHERDWAGRRRSSMAGSDLNTSRVSHGNTVQMARASSFVLARRQRRSPAGGAPSVASARAAGTESTALSAEACAETPAEDAGAASCAAPSESLKAEVEVSSDGTCCSPEHRIDD
eukprot:6187258-Pleurochrysis_carterae.AAC.2